MLDLRKLRNINQDNIYNFINGEQIYTTNGVNFIADSINAVVGDPIILPPNYTTGVPFNNLCDCIDGISDEMNNIANSGISANDDVARRRIGNLADLATEMKDNTVAAINEVCANVAMLNDNITAVNADLHDNYYNKSNIDIITAAMNDSITAVNDNVAAVNSDLHDNYYNKLNIDMINADLHDNYYNKSAINEITDAINATIPEPPDLSDYYNKSEVNEITDAINANIPAPVDLSDYYNKSQVNDITDAINANIPNVTDYYNKQEVNDITNSINNNLINPEELAGILPFLGSNDLPHIKRDSNISNNVEVSNVVVKFKQGIPENVVTEYTSFTGTEIKMQTNALIGTLSPFVSADGNTIYMSTDSKPLINADCSFGYNGNHIITSADPLIFNSDKVDISRIKNVSYLFNYCTNLTSVSDNIPETVEDVSYMFNGCTNFNQAITLPNSVINAVGMFNGCTNFNQAIVLPDNVVNVSSMFKNCFNFNQAITLPENVIYADSMFRGCNNFNSAVAIAGELRDIDNMFVGSAFNQHIILHCNNANISTTFKGSSYNCEITATGIKEAHSILPTNEFNNIINIQGSDLNAVLMIYDSNYNQPINLYGTVSNVCNMFGNGSLYNAANVKFNSAVNINGKELNAAELFNGVRNFNAPVTITGSVSNLYRAFAECNIFNQVVSVSCTNADLSNMFLGCKNLNSIISIAGTISNASSMFYNCNNFNQDISIECNNADLSRMFAECTNLHNAASITGNVNNMESMYRNCQALQSGTVVVPEGVETINSMLYNCLAYTGDVYIYSSKLDRFTPYVGWNIYMGSAFSNTQVNAVHILSSIPKETTNNIYNALVNGFTGHTFTTDNIFNDLTV